MADRANVLNLPTGTRGVPLSQNVQTETGVNPTSYSVGNGDISPGMKRMGSEIDLLPPLTPKLRMTTALGISRFPHTCCWNAHRQLYLPKDPSVTFNAAELFPGRRLAFVDTR
jgi:hypothetical protein